MTDDEKRIVEWWKAPFAFCLWWLCAHLIYAFIMLEWCPFWQWEPVSRGLNLAGSIYAVLGFFWLSKPKLQHRKD